MELPEMNVLQNIKKKIGNYDNFQMNPINLNKSNIMASVTKQVSGKKEKKQHGNGDDDIAIVDEEIEEIKMSPPKTIYDRVIQMMEKLAGNRLGQFVMEKSDRVLKVVEDTAKWGLVQDNNDVQLERPLPWIFFLTLIAWLRFFRIWLSVGSYIVGSQAVTSQMLVYYIQTKRRNLRAIRVQGLKWIRSREIETTVMDSLNKAVPFMGKLRKQIGTAICKPCQPRDILANLITVQHGKETKETSERTSKRPRDNDDAIDNNLSVDEMLDKYANEDSDNDSDYVPKEDEEDDSSSSLSSSTSAEEMEKENVEKNQDSQQNSIKNKEDNNRNSDVKPDKETTTAPQSNDQEQVHTSKHSSVTTGSADDTVTGKMLSEITEVANLLKIPKMAQIPFTTPQQQENKQKATPGHESAATLKTSIPTATNSGSPQVVHSIFHPATLFKDASSKDFTFSSNFHS